jgi:lateral signaling target protein 2
MQQAQRAVLRMFEELVVSVDIVRASYEHRLKFPETAQEELVGFFPSLWFSAECLAAGSAIDGFLGESEVLRPSAKRFCDIINSVRRTLRDQALRDPSIMPEPVLHALVEFDHAWAAFEFEYISTFVPVRSSEDFEKRQDMCVLMSETLFHAKSSGLIAQDDVDAFEPALMFTIPRLAVLYSLVRFRGAISLNERECPYMFRPQLPQLRSAAVICLTLSDTSLASVERRLCVDDPLAETSSTSGAMESDSVFLDTVAGPGTPSLGGDAAAAAALSPLASSPLPGAAALATSASTPGSRLSSASVRAVETAVLREKQLFMLVASIADQLQSSKFAQDLRYILKTIFALHATPPTLPLGGSGSSAPVSPEASVVSQSGGSGIGAGVDSSVSLPRQDSSSRPEPPQTPRAASNRGTSSNASGDATPAQMGTPGSTSTPHRGEPSPAVHGSPHPPTLSGAWAADDAHATCTHCAAPFTITRRRHHCRVCGQIFCARCSGHFSTVPQLGETPVRVCIKCFVFRLDGFLEPSSNTSRVSATRGEAARV